MVVSLSRKNLQLFQGFPIIHRPYPEEHIKPWFYPQEIDIPKCNFSTPAFFTPTSFAFNSLQRKRDIPCPITALDFGDEQPGIFIPQ